ncbi:Predicted arabinose efflux permease, MFS family [Saccharopolyspora antimicrobica]|uniref:MFS family arabinose efflux permease n=1 Tax=Saccharopolyspora antimicrobica TaxID=455193 RepID=A0A1I5FIW7_9PSEU|nr:MFS transporter [Saccharopolyspora antimicrobica]RKT82174.1 putative MFS family arabinose efflux permease [Saccharopolyspora antimicrobica]SFO23556.1 Predicted arabinose efflux permease, MFS family [Saccharopolyspora antimicrobica]
MNTPLETDRAPLRQWLAVAVLSLCTFIVVTSEMLPVGVLTPMAGGLGITPGMAGYSLTITGVVAAIAAPIVPRVLGTLDRRTVLAVAMVLLAAGNALTVLAQDFAVLVVSRTVLGIGMGVVWSLAAVVAPRLVTPRHAALAVSLAVSGVAAASVIGVPLGTLIGDAFGWRSAFGALTASALLLAAILLISLPKLPKPTASATSSTGGRPLLRTPAVVVGLIVVVFLVTAHFAAYTYIRPVLESSTGISAASIAAILLAYGVFGLIGNFAAGALAAKRSRATVVLLAFGILVAITILALFSAVAAIAIAAIVVWGLAYGGLSVAGQIWMTRAATGNEENVTGLYVGVFTASIALGAFLGGTVFEIAGMTPLLWTAAALALAALATGLLGPGPSTITSEPRIPEKVPAA